MKKAPKPTPAVDLCPKKPGGESYARVSSKEQGEGGLFYSRANKAAQGEYAAANGFAIAHEYVDVETAERSR